MAKKGLVKKIGTSFLAGAMFLGSSLPGLEKKVHAQEPLPAEYSLAQWMTPIKSQGPYGLCFDFAAIAAIESKIKMMVGNPNYNPNLSEQQYPCGTGNYTQGGSSGAVLGYARDVGIVEEKTLPFVGPSSSCQIPANAKRYFVKSFNDLGHPWPPSYDPEEIRNKVKKALIEKGPLVMDMTLSGSKDANGIYKCNGNKGTGHSVVIYGYKETGDIHTSYWQVKDSSSLHIDKIGMDWYINYPDYGIDDYFDQCDLTMSNPTFLEVSPLNHLANSINALKVITGTPVADLNIYETDCNQNGVIDPADAVCSLQKAAELR
jgi:hypothetical protein